MSLLVFNNTNVSAKSRKYNSSFSKFCTNCGEELSDDDRKQICSGACRQERNVRIQIGVGTYKNLKQNQ